MKTPEEWLEEPSYAAWTATREDIAAIQADAQEGMVPAAELRPTIELLRHSAAVHWALHSATGSVHDETSKRCKAEAARLETLLGQKPDGQ